MNTQNENVKKETEIDRVMNDLSKEVGSLNQSVEAIEARLTGITRNSRPSEPKEQGDTPYETNLAQNINKNKVHIQELRERLDDLLNRIEL